MRGRGEWRTALAAMAAMAGVGFASGRQFALFFGQLGDAGWLGMAAASATTGLMTGVMAWRNRRLGPVRASDVPGVVLGVLRSALAAMTAAMMLLRAGDMGALALPLRHGYAFGAAFAVAIALLLARKSTVCLPALGLAAVLAAGLFYAGLALDARPVRLYARSETELRLAGSAGWALLLAALFAAMNACAAAWALEDVPGAARPARLGGKVGMTLFALLALEAAAIRRGGDALLPQPMPWVLLSARWGTAGFWSCAGFEYLCAVATLSAALARLIGQVKAGGAARASALYMLLASGLLFIVLSFGRL